MTPAAFLVAELRAAGIRLAVDGDRLVARGRRLPPDLAARLRERKTELMALLMGGERPHNPQIAGSGEATADCVGSVDGSGGPVPTTECLGRGTAAWWWCPAWPESGTGRWLCRTCTSRPAPSVAEVYAGLTAEERAQLEGAARAGDRLAWAALEAVAETAPAGASAAVADLARTVSAVLRDVGWIVVFAKAIGEEVVFIRDQAVAVPAEYAALPRFDCDELALLVAQRPSADRLRALCDVKRELPGARVVADSGERLTPARDVFPITTTKGTNHEPEGVQGRLGKLGKKVRSA